MATLAALETPQLFKLVKQKRKMFEYEHEVRVMGERGISNPNLVIGEIGIACPFEGKDGVWRWIRDFVEG